MDTIILFTIWLIFYLSIRKQIKSGKLYFLLLMFMLLPVALDSSDMIMSSWFHDVHFINMVVFALCLVGGFLPWLVFDRWNKRRIFIVPDKSVPTLKIIFTILILGSVYSILYTIPFAIKALTLGADQVRFMIKTKGSLMPSSPLTTIAVTFAGCNIFAILFFYIACLTPALKKYRIWLIISSLSYVVSCFAITARDGLIILPCFYIVFYIVFNRSLSESIQIKAKKSIKYLVIFAAVFMAIFSFQRFYKEESSLNELYQGTVGYMSQQRYVFDEVITKQNDFWGLEHRFPLYNRLIGIPDHEVKINREFEWSFGTMYAEFYDAFGWSGLIIMSLIFISFYYFSFRLLKRFNSTFGLLMMFTVYFYIALTGMFYTRAGGSVSMNLFYLILSVMPFFLPNIVSSKKTRIRCNDLLNNNTASQHSDASGALPQKHS